jgi:hypothetical protein
MNSPCLNTTEDCSVLLKPLAYQDDLPKHVCIRTMKESCQKWFRDNAHFRGRFSPLTRIVVPIGGGHALCFQRYGTSGYAPSWPPTIEGSDRQVVLIIQQWAEVGLSDKHLKTLAARPEWSRMLEAVRRRYEDELVRVAEEEEALKESDLDEAVKEILPRPSPLTLAASAAEAFLLSSGFPFTPGMVDYVIKQTLPDIGWQQEPAPTAGALVTSFLTEASLGPSFSEMICSTAISYSPLAKAVRRRVGEVEARHQAWWNKLWLNKRLNKLRLPAFPPPVTAGGRPVVEDPDLLADHAAWRNGQMTPEEFWARAFQRADARTSVSQRQEAKRLRSWLAERNLSTPPRRKKS